jgi:cold shock CspA family protein
MDKTTINTVVMQTPLWKNHALGDVKWFGGLNGQTGRENNYGFISAPDGDLYFHRSQSLSPSEALVSGAKVAFFYAEAKNGKPTAESVRVLSLLPDAELIALIQCSEALPPEDTLTIILCRNTLGPCESEALRAVLTLSADGSLQNILLRFWEKFPPASPKDQFFLSAPNDIKQKVCKQHYSEFRKMLNALFSSVAGTETSLKAETIYRELDKQDEQIALHWAGREDYEGLLAKMLSARAAERAAKKFYEGTGSTVDDVSIKQLNGGSGDWTTHDLLVDLSVAVDVKNARRPVNGTEFYVEHTVPRFKLDRKNAHVKIAGILSPYLSLEYIRKPGNASFNIDDLIFLGETDRDSIDRLVSTFGSPTFEVARVSDGTIPHWVFGYPRAWYRAFSEDLRRFTNECDWPEGDEWEYVLNESERIRAIPALCAARKPLPAAISSRLQSWQSDFYTKMQRLSGESPELPVIFLAVLTDFIKKLKNGHSDFSPKDYLPLLFSEDPGLTVSYPLGAIDPLGLIRRLVQTLEDLWDCRSKTKLENLSNFRFSGLGILQGREKDRWEWKTLVAYCGGIAYKMDTEGNVILNSEGKPSSIKGKCGKAPLVIGIKDNCQTCGKLVCGQCGFCSRPCQERDFAERFDADRMRAEQARNRRVTGPGRANDDSSRWEEIPLDVYEGDSQRR